MQTSLNVPLWFARNSN